MKQQSRISLLKAALDQWRAIPRISQSVIAVEVVGKINELGFKEVLAAMGISFAETGDHYHDARVNAQKLFRWFGESDEGIYQNFDAIWQIEQPLVAAMPDEIRNRYLTSIWSVTGAHVTKSCEIEGTDGEINFTTLINNAIKESAEGLMAIVELPKSSTFEELNRHEQEICESIAAFQSAHEVVIQMIEEKAEGTNLKAVS